MEINEYIYIYTHTCADVTAMSFEFVRVLFSRKLGFKELTSNLFHKKQDVTPIQLVQETCGN